MAVEMKGVRAGSPRLLKSWGGGVVAAEMKGVRAGSPRLLKSGGGVCGSENERRATGVRAGSNERRAGRQPVLA